MSKPWENDKIVEGDAPATGKPWERDKIFDGDVKQAAPVDDDPYRVKEAWTALKTAGKGVPVLGNYINTDDAMRKFAEDNPWTSKGLEVAGGLTSFIPVVKGVQLASKAIPLAQRLLPQMGIYGAIGAGSSAADTATNPDAQEGDVAANAKTGGLLGMMGPLAGHMLSPRSLPKTRPSARAPEPGSKVRGSDPFMGDPAHRMGPLGKIADDALDRAFASASKAAKDKAINAEMPGWVKSIEKLSEYNKRISPGTRMLTSGLLTGGGLFGGVGALPAMAIGSLPYTAPAAIKGLRRAGMATWANKPIKGTNLTTKDIVNAMALQEAGNTGE